MCSPTSFVAPFFAWTMAVLGVRFLNQHGSEEVTSRLIRGVGGLRHQKSFFRCPRHLAAATLDVVRSWPTWAKVGL